MKYHGHGLSMVTQSTAPVSPCSDDAIAVSAVGRPTHVRVVNVLLIVLSRTSMPLNRRLRERT